MKRRSFIKKSMVVTSSLYLPGALHLAGAGEVPAVVKVSGLSPYEITKRAVLELGGMKKFVSKGEVVMIKPNIGWNRPEAMAANTNPNVIRAVVEMVLEAGAKKVIVMDNPLHKAEECYQNSGIGPAAKKAGAELRFPDDNRLTLHDFKGERVKKWPVYRDFLEVDKFIDVPILKHHNSAGLTIAMKNLYGILGGKRGKLHRNMGMGIADMAAGFKVDLTIVDAFRVLMAHGPIGGRLSDVEEKRTVIASANIMEADVVAADLFGDVPEKYEFIRAAFDKKLGRKDVAAINPKIVKI
ncbi:MAG: DUF362 domain-containing protein [bacterium]|nr:DUF362 domain-containing protein [bacterium]